MLVDPHASASQSAKPSPDSLADQIISVNDRSQRPGGGSGPFFVMGAIVLVVLICGILTVNVVRPKLTRAAPTASQPSFTAVADRIFPLTAPPLPGASPQTSPTRPQPMCADGTSGESLHRSDGRILRDASGADVKACPDGQVIGEAGLPPQPIPVAAPAGGKSRSLPATPAGELLLSDGGHDAVPGGGDTANTLQTAPEASLRAISPSGGPNVPRYPSLALERRLQPSGTTAVQAALMGDLNVLLPKGRTIECGLSVRIITTVAGLASCVVTQNVYSANGRVLLLERGSEAVGEYRSDVANGQRRLFILWNRIVTPAGISIELQSPGADTLGAAGLTGRVDTHWFERIGAAFLLSSIEDAVQYEIASAQAKSGGATFVLGTTSQTGGQMAQKVLSETIDIPPTLYNNQGDRCLIYVARDLDFSNVYALRLRH